MTSVSAAEVAEFRERGYVLIPGVLDEAQVARGRRIAAQMLAAEPPGETLTGPYFLWPRFGAAGHQLLEFYRDAGIGSLASGLLRKDLTAEEPESAQLATTVPHWPHRPGAPHVDGLTPLSPDGFPATFSLLAGVWLTGHEEPHRGNLWLWPGTHLRFGAWLAERGAGALGHVELMNTGPYPDVDLGQPVQVCGPAGSVLFAHYLLGHNTGGHEGPPGSPSRQVIYFRLHATGHRARWRAAVTSPLLEFRSGGTA
jgi:hypothetical protein